ncbi:MAG: ATP-binding protein [Cycloclasticus sp.]
MESSFNQSWQKLIRRYIYTLVVLILLLVVISAGYAYWINSKKEWGETVAYQYHSTSSTYYLNAMEELRHLQNDMNHTLLLQSSRPLPKQIEVKLLHYSETSLLNLVRQHIKSGVSLHEKFPNKQFNGLILRLEQQLLIFNENFYSYRKTIKLNSELPTNIDGLLLTLKQLIRLHTVTREDILLELANQTKKQNQFFFLLGLSFLFTSMFIVWRTVKSVNRVVIENEIAFSVIIDELEKTKKRTEKINLSLEDKNSELERFTYTVSHDLKSPLVTVKGFIGLLIRDIKEGNEERINNDLAKIAAASDKMGVLLNDLLELSRVGRVINKPQTIRLTELFEEARSLVEGQMSEAGATVSIENNMPSIYADRHRMIEVAQNLLDNAIKFRAKGVNPIIDVSAEVVDGQVHCSVKDNGIGINPKYHNKVFGLFDRLDLSFDGTGVGLALVKRIVEVHNGTVMFDSEGEGLGCTFRFALPEIHTE